MPGVQGRARLAFFLYSASAIEREERTRRATPPSRGPRAGNLQPSSLLSWRLQVRKGFDRFLDHRPCSSGIRKALRVFVLLGSPAGELQRPMECADYGCGHLLRRHLADWSDGRRPCKKVCNRAGFPDHCALQTESGMDSRSWLRSHKSGGIRRTKGCRCLSVLSGSGGRPRKEFL
jgi:hypothetical protein